jgi:hypothetical protein
MDMQEIIKQLTEERGRIDAALKALGAASSKKTQGILGTRRTKGRKLSAAARKRIGDAQRERWAKQKTN